MTNLVADDAWLPVRRVSTRARDWITPHQLSDPDVLAFDADRPDFNGALAQFAIGLLQTVSPVNGLIEWARYFKAPPPEDELKRWFEPVAAAFLFDGDGARFMQDRTLRPEDGAINDIAALLIEAPGEQTLKNNADHFIKRGHVVAMCPDCAAMALLTLQLNAPSGGAGHRTGLRGGGPLTTLVACQPPRSLWHDLWLNVRERDRFLAGGGDAGKTEPYFTFPWLADISKIQKEGGETAPVQVHPAHIFWAMPRRIRLDFDNVTSGACGICGRQSERLLRQYVTKNYGLNYKGPWNHPLSPYYENKNDWLPMHPQPGGLGYRHWLGWVLGVQSEKKHQRPADIVTHYFEHRARAAGGGALRLWAFGYDMDNMKARCWYESSLPIYGLTDCDKSAQKQVQSEVRNWLAGAELAASYLRGAVKDAWFGGDARGDFSMVDAGFWSRTEPLFYALLQKLIEALREQATFDEVTARQSFHGDLAGAALWLFDKDFVGAGMIERQHPRRVAAAHRQLRSSLYGPKLRQALGLAPPDSAEAKPKRSRKTAQPPA